MPTTGPNCEDEKLAIWMKVRRLLCLGCITRTRFVRGDCARWFTNSLLLIFYFIAECSLKKQRALFKKGRLLPERQGKLEAIDFAFEPSKQNQSPSGSSPSRPTRTLPVRSAVRGEDHEKRIGTEHLADDQWDKMFRVLKAYRKKHGDTLVVTSGSNVSDPKLATWVSLTNTFGLCLLLLFF